ncbi:MAG: hypothetical protein DMG67_14150 [Acidobacteria bacterium]|nr:MAG: hypothetical protein DMG67_14150 [Acidobacteriota bacterium]
MVAPPIIIKAFGAGSIPLNGATSLTFTLQNNNSTTTLTGIGFSDTLPAGLVIATPNGLTTGCQTVAGSVSTAGTVTATQGTNVISLSGLGLNASGSCTFSVNVKGTSAGMQNNTTGNVTSANGGTGGTASASVNVEAPPSIAKVFNPATIALNATTSLTFTITNPGANVDPLTGVAFTDTLPTGLTVANASATVCGGTLTTTNPTGIALSGATINTNSQCQFSVTVTGATAGNYLNTTGNVTSTNGGTGNTASANLTVLPAPPVIIKFFGAASVPLNGSTSLSFTIQNNNTTTTLTGVGFSDTLPAGLVVSTPNGISGSCGGGTITATQGTNVISLSGASIAASSSCTFAVNVTGIAAGTQNNTTGNVTSANGGTGGTASATLKVEAPPSIAKAFGAANIPLSGTTSLTFTITNPAANPDALSGVAFTDTLPAGLTVANASATVCGGTLTTTNPSGIALSGATINTNSQCQFSVTVTGATNGTKNNITGNVTSTNGGTGNTASASIVVGAAADISVTLTHVPDPAAIGGSLRFIATVTNNGPNTANVTFAGTFTGAQYLVSATSTLGTCGVTEPVNCNLGSMTNGQSATVTITVTPLLGRNVVANVTVTPDVPDPNNSNNSASSTARIRFKPQHF